MERRALVQKKGMWIASDAIAERTGYATLANAWLAG
jgi:hypothetical protein